MPTKGSTQRASHRDYIMSKVWWTAYQKEQGEDSLAATVDYTIVQEVVDATLKLIQETIIKDPSGFKLPEDLGYLVVNKYPSSKKIVDPVLSKKLGTKVYYRNMHSLGYMFSVRWYAHRIARNQFSHIYRFLPARSLARGVSKAIKDEAAYQHWSHSDFVHFHRSTK